MVRSHIVVPIGIRSLILLVLPVSTGVASAAADPDTEFENLTTKCMIQLSLFSYGDAENTARRMQALAEGPLKDHPLRLAEAKAYRAYVCTRLDRFDEAETLYRDALTIGDPLLPEHHPKRSLAYQGLGYLYETTGRGKEAVEMFQRAATIAEKVYSPQDPRLAMAIGNLAGAYQLTGDYAEAQRLYGRAEEIYRTSDQLDVADQIALWRGASFLDQGRHADAQRVIVQVLENRGNRLGKEHSLTSQSQLARVLLLRVPGKESDAEKPLRDVLSGETKDSVLTAHVRYELACVYLRQGRNHEAQVLLEKALAIQERLCPKDHPDVACTLLELSRTEMNQGRTGEAEKHLDRAIEVFDHLGINVRPRWECYCTRATLLWQAGQRDRALNDLKRACAQAEEQRMRFSGGELERTAAFAEYTDAFEKMVAWQRDLGDVDEAFDAMERSRARSLGEQMTTRGINLLAGLPAAEAERLGSRERQAQLRVASVERQLQTLKNRLLIWPRKRAEEQKKLEADLEAARQAWADAYAELRNASPAYRLACSQDRKPVGLDGLQKYAQQEGLLVLEYFCGQEGSYVLVVPAAGQPRLQSLSVTDVQAERLGIAAGHLTARDLEHCLQNEQQTGVLQHLRRSANRSLPSGVVRSLVALAEILVPATERQDLAAGQYRRLMICPDAALASLPFETLVTEAGRDPVFLLDVAPPMVYAPSTTILINLAEREAGRGTSTRPPVLTVGDCRYAEPSHTPDEMLLAQLPPGSRYTSVGGRLTPLPYSAREIQWVADVFGDQGVSVAWLKGDWATEETVRYNASDRRIVHFACHGLADQEYGNLFGALALTSGPKDDDPKDDGFLTLAEIYELNLKGCELAILSACDTNYGPHQRGEGVWALSRGFLVAGAGRVVASNWLVDDESAPSLMSYFCSILAKAEAAGEKPDYAEALWKAKRWLRSHEQWESPYYWGTFVLIGPN